MLQRKGYIALITAATMASCNAADDKLIPDQQTAIVNFLTGKGFEYDRAGGVYRHIANADREGYNDADSIVVGDEVTFDFDAYTFSSGPGTMFYTSKPESISKMGLPFGSTDNGDVDAQAGGWQLSPRRIRLGSDPLMGSIAVAMPGCRQGDSVALFITSDLAYNRKPMGPIPKDTPLVYVLNIRNVTK